MPSLKIKADRVKELSLTVGTIPFVLSGADISFLPFSSVMSIGDTCYYVALHKSSGQWETGIGTYSSTNTLTRTTILSSSNLTSPATIVNFFAGDKYIFISAIANAIEDIAYGGTGLSALGSANQVLTVNSLGTALEYRNPVNPTLDALTDVVSPNPTDKNLLQYNVTSLQWETVPGPTGTVVGTTDIQTLTNKTLVTPALVTPLSNTLSAVPVTANNAGNSLTISAGSGVGTGPQAGGSVILQAGLQQNGGGDGKVIVRQVSGQTSNLQEWQSSASTPVVLSAFDSSGRLGIGTASPSAPIHISATNGYLFKAEGKVAGADALFSVTDEASYSNQILFGYSNGAGMGNAGNPGSYLWTYNSDLFIYQYSAKNIRLYTNRIERIRITSGGDVGIGLTVPTARTHIVTVAATKGLIVQGAASQTANLQEWQNSNADVLASVSAAGSMTVTGGTVVASTPLLDLSQTWNNAAVQFTGIKLNVTNTASAATSDLIDLQANGASLIRLKKNGPFNYYSIGNTSQNGGSWLTQADGMHYFCRGDSQSSAMAAVGYYSTPWFNLVPNGLYAWSQNGASLHYFADTALGRNAAGVVEINNGTAGAFRDLILRDIKANTLSAIPVTSGLTATVTAASGSGTIITYTATNTFTVGRTVSVTGLATGTAASLNIAGMTIATASSTNFTVINSTVGASTGTESASATSGGNWLTIAAGSAVGSGAGGNLILQAGIQATSGGDGKVIVRQVSGQTGNYFELQTSVGLLAASIEKKSALLLINRDSTYAAPTFMALQPSTSGENHRIISGANSGNMGLDIMGGALNGGTSLATSNIVPTYASFNADGRVGIALSNPSARFHVVGRFNGSGTDTKIMIVQAGSATQANNLQEWQNSAGTALAFVDASGNPFANTLSAVPIVKTASVTAATGTGTTITYTAANTYSIGQIVSVTGLATSTGSSLNIANMTIASVTALQFTVTNATVGVSSGTGTVTDGLAAIITAATGSGTTITYTADNTFTAGHMVSVRGLTTSTGTSLNIANMIIATRTSTQFTVTNATVGVSSGMGIASGGFAASVTAATGTGAIITYTAANTFVSGRLVSVSGLGTASGTTLNIANMIIASATATQFTVVNGTVGVSSGTGTALIGINSLAIGPGNSSVPGTTAGAINIIAGSGTASSVKGGDVNITAGTGGPGTTENVYAGGGGGSVIITAGSSGSGDNSLGAGSITITAGGGNTAVPSGTVTVQGGPMLNSVNIAGAVSILGGMVSNPGNTAGLPGTGSVIVASPDGLVASGSLNTLTANPTGSVILRTGSGSTTAASATLPVTCGSSGPVSITTGTGGVATNSGTTRTGGASGTITLATSAGGNASGGATANNGGSSGSILLSTGIAGTGATVNGAVGVIKCTVAGVDTAIVDTVGLTVNALRAFTVTPGVGAVVTAATGASGIITYTAANTFVVGAVVSVGGLGVSSGTTLNINNMIISTVSSTQFTVINATVGVSSGTGAAVVALAALVTAATGSGTTITYIAANTFTAGHMVSVANLTTATGTTLNIADMIIASATATQFTVTNTTVGTSSGTGTATGGLRANITAATGASGVITYTALNTFTVGRTVSVTGLGVSSGTTLNIAGMTIATATSSQFTVVNATVGVSSGTGTATAGGNTLADAASNAVTAGPGGNRVITAGNGVSVGKGGDIILQPGAQGSSGGNGKLIVLKADGSNSFIVDEVSRKFTLYGTGGGYFEVIAGTNTYGSSSLFGGDNIVINNKVSFAFLFNSTGFTFSNNNSSGQFAVHDTTNIKMHSAGFIGFASYITGVGNFTAALDAGIGRAAVGVVSVVSSTAGAGGSLSFPSSTTAIATNTNDLALTASAFQRINCTSAASITGIAPPTGGTHVDGRMIRVYNVGTANLTLSHNSSSSSAANRVFSATGADIVVPPKTVVDLTYDATDNGSGVAGWKPFAPGSVAANAITATSVASGAGNSLTIAAGSGIGATGTNNGANLILNPGEFATSGTRGTVLIDGLNVGKGIGSAGGENTVFGFEALSTVTTGYYLTAIGHQALKSNTTQANQTAIGWSALKSNNGGSNTAVGGWALGSSVGGYGNTAVGFLALKNSEGQLNVAVGLYSAVACGGNYNTTIGSYSGFTGVGNLDTGTGNILVGYNVGMGSGNNAANNSIVIGYNGVGNGSNTTTIGNTSTTATYLYGTISAIPVASGAGNSLTIAAGSGIGTGSGANLILNPGEFATSGTRGTVLIDGLNVGKGKGSGVDNTVVGAGALAANTTGGYNTAVGRSALSANTSGGYNTAIGYQALQSNTTGDTSTAFGYMALQSNTTGICNTAIGVQALQANTTGEYNLANGQGGLLNNTTGNRNLAVGYMALRYNIAGHYNVAVGFSALVGSTGSYNTGHGYLAGGSITTGSNNTFLGNESGYNASQLVTASNSMALGNGAFTTASNQVVIGNTSVTQIILNGTATTNAIAAIPVTSGAGNSLTIAAGSGVGTGNGANLILNPGEFATSGTRGTVLIDGLTVGRGKGTAANNVVVGINALPVVTNGDNNVAIGTNALLVTSSSQNNIAIGFDTLKATIGGGSNVGIGTYALRGNTSGEKNVAIGITSLVSNGSGTYNVGIGYQALQSNSTGSSNIGIGYNAGFTGTALTTGTSNTIVGHSADMGTGNAAATNSIIIGANAIGNGSNTTTIGNTSTTNTYLYGTISAIPVASGAGNSVTIAAGAGVGTGAGGSLILQAGLQATSGGDGKVIVRQVSGQTSNLQEWQNSAGTALAFIDSTGTLKFTSNTGINGSGNTLQLISGGAANVFFTGGGLLLGQGGQSFSQTIQLTNGGTGLDYNAGNFTFISGRGTGAGSAGSFIFQTADVQSSSSTAQPITTKMTLLGNGNLGIGTTSPTARNHIVTVAATKGLIVQGASSQTANLQEWQDSAGAAFLSLSSTGVLTLNNSVAAGFSFVCQGRNFSINTSGVLIWTAAAVFGNSSWTGAGYNEFHDGNSGKYVGFFRPGNNAIALVARGGAGQTLNLQEWQDSAGTVLSAFDSTGRLGIGTASPTYPLTVRGAGTALIVNDAGNSGTLFLYSTVHFIKGANGYGLALSSYGGSGDPIRFVFSGTEKASIDWLGNIKTVGSLSFPSSTTAFPNSQAASNKALTSNVATITIPTAHGYVVGANVVVAISDAVFDGTFILTAVTATTISYAKTNANVTSAAATGTVTYSPNDIPLTASAFQRINCTTASNLTGIAPPTGGTHVDGRMIRVYNVGAANLTLSHNSSSSSAANRVFSATGADIVVPPKTVVDLTYDATDNGSGVAGWKPFAPGSVAANAITATSVAVAATVTAASGNGTTVTYTCASTFAIGQVVSITGLTTTGSSLNLSNQTITGVTATTFTVTNATVGTAAATQAGTATIQSAGNSVTITGGNGSGIGAGGNIILQPGAQGSSGGNGVTKTYGTIESYGNASQTTQAPLLLNGASYVWNVSRDTYGLGIQGTGGIYMSSSPNRTISITGTLSSSPTAGCGWDASMGDVFAFGINVNAGKDFAYRAFGVDVTGTFKDAWGGRIIQARNNGVERFAVYNNGDIKTIGSISIPSSTTAFPNSQTVSNKAHTSSVATITTLNAHGYVVGDNVVVAISDGEFDGTFILTAVTATTISYAKTNANVTSAAATGTVTYSPNDIPLTASAFQRINCTTASNLTGIAPPTGGTHVDGRMIRVYNVGTANLTLSHNSGSSTTANRFWNVTAADIIIAPNDFADLTYDLTSNGSGSAGWRVA